MVEGPGAIHGRGGGPGLFSCIRAQHNGGAHVTGYDDSPHPAVCLRFMHSSVELEIVGRKFAGLCTCKHLEARRRAHVGFHCLRDLNAAFMGPRTDVFFSPLPCWQF